MEPTSYVTATVLNVPIDESKEHYQVQIKDTGDIANVIQIKNVDHRQDPS